MLILSKENIEACFNMKEAVRATKEAMKIYSKGQTIVPLRVNLPVAEENGQSLYMPAYAVGEEGCLGVKIVSSYPDNMAKGLPTIPATMVVLNPETGIVDAIIDGTYLTQLRTGAIQGAATEELSRQDAKIAALIGTGGQAKSQLEAMLTVRELTEVRIFDINLASATSFAKEMAEVFADFKAIFRPCSDVSEAVRGADIITTVTTSKQATFDAEDVKEGAHVNGVGAYTPEMKEVPSELIQRADSIIFDTWDAVMAEAGDFIEPLAKGLVTEEDYDGEFGQLLLGEIKGRQSATDITVFKSVGSAVLDVVTAQLIVNKARELGIGNEISI